jgi:hypothetical protein
MLLHIVLPFVDSTNRSQLRCLIFYYWLILLQTERSYAASYCFTVCWFYKQVAAMLLNILLLIASSTNRAQLCCFILFYPLLILQTGRSYAASYCFTLCWFYKQVAATLLNILLLIASSTNRSQLRCLIFYYWLLLLQTERSYAA